MCGTCALRPDMISVTHGVARTEGDGERQIFLTDPEHVFQEVFCCSLRRRRSSSGPAHPHNTRRRRRQIQIHENERTELRMPFNFAVRWRAMGKRIASGTALTRHAAAATCPPAPSYHLRKQKVHPFPENLPTSIASGACCWKEPIPQELQCTHWHNGKTVAFLLNPKHWQCPHGRRVAAVAAPVRGRPSERAAPFRILPKPAGGRCCSSRARLQRCPACAGPHAAGAAYAPCACDAGQNSSTCS